MYITYFFKFFIHSTLKYILIKPENHWIKVNKKISTQTILLSIHCIFTLFVTKNELN